MRTDNKKPAVSSNSTAGKANQTDTAILAAASRPSKLLTSVWSAAKLLAFCMAVAALPAACTALTGRAPINCAEAFCDL